jgi:hypothetical protein
MHYARDPVGGVEVFAIPLTITNHGARDAIIISLDLGVAPDKSGRPASLTFASAYVGSNPAREKQPFTPLSIPGRGSFTGIVLFYPNDPGTARRTRWSSARRLTAGTVLSGQRHDSRSRLPGGQRFCAMAYGARHFRLGRRTPA